MEQSAGPKVYNRGIEIETAEIRLLRADAEYHKTGYIR
jgi:hypothetical protein